MGRVMAQHRKEEQRYRGAFLYKKPQCLLQRRGEEGIHKYARQYSHFSKLHRQ